MNKDKLIARREFLTANTWLTYDYTKSAQAKGAAKPADQKPAKSDQEIINLPEFSDDILENSNILDLIKSRKTRRQYTDQALSMRELSFLVWATQGLRNKSDKTASRTVPSGGNRHSFETYLAINRVEGLAPGIYRYLPFEHALILEQEFSDPAELQEKMKEAAKGQLFFAKAAVGFIWTTLPYRTEWRYSENAAKMIAQDSGHICQNLYLAAEAIGCGTCAIGAYSQKDADNLVSVDGKDELVIYMAPIGKV
jgi:SagB-type dehydrogenase family enzyme